MLTGQSFTVTYTVTNAGGDTPTAQAAGTTSIYLSRDQFLSDADTYVGTQSHHTGGLAAGRYLSAATVTLKLPRGLTGPWYVFVLTDAPHVHTSRAAWCSRPTRKATTPRRPRRRC